MNVTVYPSTPERVEVRWKTPAKPNGDPEDLTYEVEWRTENNDGSSSNGNVKATKTRLGNATDGYHSMDIDHLEAEKTYFFKVFITHQVQGMSLISRQDLLIFGGYLLFWSV